MEWETSLLRSQEREAEDNQVDKLQPYLLTNNCNTTVVFPDINILPCS
jgi:hypothetical protein